MSEPVIPAALVAFGAFISCYAMCGPESNMRDKLFLHWLVGPLVLLICGMAIAYGTFELLGSVQ